MSMIKFAVDLLWVRHKIVGGTESFVNNLLLGFSRLKDDYCLYLICAKDNYQLFEKYTEDSRVQLIITKAESKNVWRRIIWQNMRLNKLLEQKKITICLEPVYAKPIIGTRKIRYITVIHDLEAIHNPQNHNIITNIWLRICWWNSVHTSKYVVAISNFVREDIIKKYRRCDGKVITIYDPIIIKTKEQCSIEELYKLYGIKDNEYYYTVSKLNPHKNLDTLVKVFGEMKKRDIHLPRTLIVSGVDGGQAALLKNLSANLGISTNVIMTGYVENSIRNALYRHARAFLFPSVFEGFGMPLVEAMSLSTPVVTTTKCSMQEVTQGLANYVKDPYSIDEWIEKMIKIENNSSRFKPEMFLPEIIAKQYINLLNEVAKND